MATDAMSQSMAASAAEATRRRWRVTVRYWDIEGGHSRQNDLLCRVVALILADRPPASDLSRSRASGVQEPITRVASLRTRDRTAPRALASTDWSSL